MSNAPLPSILESIVHMCGRVDDPCAFRCSCALRTYCSNTSTDSMHIHCIVCLIYCVLVLRMAGSENKSNFALDGNFCSYNRAAISLLVIKTGY